MITARDRIQMDCRRYVQIAYPEVAPLLIESPRDKRGAVKGHSDMILLVPSGHYGALCITIKVGGAPLNMEQEEWKGYATLCDNKYITISSLNEFMQLVAEYLNKTTYVHHFDI